MNINAEKMDKPGMNLPYEQPTLKKYGTMKEFTFASGGSGGDTLGNSNFNRTDNASQNSGADVGSPDNDRGLDTIGNDKGPDTSRDFSP